MAGHEVPAGHVLADRIAAELAARADAARVDGMRRYMRDQFPFLGVTAPAQKAAWRAATADLARRLPEPVVIEAVRDLWARPEREHQYLACTLANRHARPAARGSGPTPRFLDTVEALLTTRPWWDTVDALATHAVGDLVRAHPQLRDRMDAWLVGEDMWLIRSALLHMNRWRADTDVDWLFVACLTQGAHRDFFVRKAIGWALREYSKVDAAAVVAFVDMHADDLSGLSRREAVMWLERRRRSAKTGGLTSGSFRAWIPTGGAGAMTVAAEENEFLARIRAMARAVQRVSTWVAGAALAVGLVTLAALWPWFTRPGGPGVVVGAAVSLVLVAAPLRVIWHGRRIVAVYGHPGHIEGALESVPGALDEAIVGLEAVANQPGRGLRGMIGTYRAVTAVQEMWDRSPAFGPVRAVVEPVHPDKLGITMAAVWVSLGTLVLGLPVAFASVVALALT